MIHCELSILRARTGNIAQDLIKSSFRDATILNGVGGLKSRLTIHIDHIVIIGILHPKTHASRTIAQHLRHGSRSCLQRLVLVLDDLGENANRSVHD